MRSEKYTIIPCTVKMPVAGFQGMKSGLVTPPIVAKSLCSEAYSGNVDFPLNTSHSHCLWEGYVDGCMFRGCSEP